MYYYDRLQFQNDLLLRPYVAITSKSFKNIDHKNYFNIN